MNTFTSNSSPPANISWASMNSQIKDALSDFINSNTSAIEKAMENESHELGKGEPAIADLVNYLTLPTPLTQKDTQQPMSLEEKNAIHNPNFHPTQMQTSQQNQYNSSQLQHGQEATQYTNNRLVAPTSDSSFSGGSHQNSVPPAAHHGQQQQQFLQHHDSYGQSGSVYPDSGGGSAANTYTDTQTGYESTNRHQSDVIQNHNQTVGSDVSYHNPGQSVQYQTSVPGETNKQYHHTLQTQFSNTDSSTGQYQTRAQSDSSVYQDSSVLPASFASSTSSQLHYNSSQNNYQYGMMDVNQTVENNSESDSSQFKVSENMNVDEPDTVYRPTGHESSIGNYQQDFQTKSATHETALPSGSHLPTYNSEGFQQHSVPQNSAASNFSGDSFKPSGPRTSTSHPASQYPDPSNQNFQQDTSYPQPSAQLSAASNEFPGQKNGVQNNAAVKMDSSNYTSPPEPAMPQASSTGYAVQSPPCHPQHSYNTSQASPYQPSQYQGSPVPNMSHASPGAPDTFQQSQSATGTPNSSKGFSQPCKIISHNTLDAVQYQHSPSSHQPVSADQSHFQQSPAASADYNSEATHVLSPSEHSVGYPSSVASPLNSTVPYSQTPSASIHQQQGFMNTSVQQSASSGNDVTRNFIGYSASDLSLHPTDLSASGALTSNSAAHPNYAAASSLDQSQDFGDSIKMSNVTPSDQSRFSDDTDSFPQLDLESVVAGNFEVATSSSGLSHDSTGMSNESEAVNFSGYQYTDSTPTSVSFPRTSQKSDEGSSQTGLEYEYSQHNLSVASEANSKSFMTDQPSSTPASGTGTQNEGYMFGMQPASHETNESYPQPMQIQDSDFACKTSETSSSYAYQATATGNDGVNNSNSSNNTETAMDISVGLGEKNENLSSGLSYEEIHMSIVKAGDALSRNTGEIKHVNQQAVFHSSLSQSEQPDNNSSSGIGQSVYVTESPGYYQTDNSLSHAAISYALSQSGVVTSSVATTAIASQSVNFGVGSSHISASSSSVPSSFSNIDVEQNLITGLLNTIQASSAPSSHYAVQDQISNQTVVTVPNFLEKPAAVVSCIRSSNPDNVSLVTPASMPPGQGQNRFVVTMIAASPANSRPVVASSGLNQPKVVAVTGISTSQQQIINPATSFVHNMTSNPQIINSVVNLPMSASTTTTSFLAQPHFGGINISSVNQANNLGNSFSLGQVIPASGLTLPSSSAEIAPCSGVFVQVVGQQGENKPSVLPTASAVASKPALLAPKPSPSGVTTVLIPSSGGNNNSQTGQAHIIMSLEDLQKLLSPQTSQSSQPTQSLAQNQVPAQSPQTLVFQKPAMPPIRQNQPQHPKLLIRGPAVPNPPRLMHPHQQLQQTREKLQLLVQQAHQSQSFSTPFPTQKIPDHTVVSATQDSLQKSQTPVPILVTHREQQKMQMSQQTVVVDQQPKIQLHFKQALTVQQQQQTVQNFVVQTPTNSDQKLPPLQLLGQQQLTLSHSQQQSQTDKKNPFAQPQLQQFQAHNTLHLVQMQQELQQLQRQQEKEQEQEEEQLKLLHLHHQQQLQGEKAERSGRPCSDSLKKDYKHLHSLLTGDSASVPAAVNSQAKALPPVLNFPSSLQGRSNTAVSSGSLSAPSVPTLSRSFDTGTQVTSAPLSFLPLSSAPFLNSAASSTPSSFSSIASGSSQTGTSHSCGAPLTTLAFTNVFSTPAFSKSFDSKELKAETGSNPLLPSVSESSEMASSFKGENASDMCENESEQTSNRQASILAKILTESKRSHSPLSVDLSSPANSNSEAPSPLSSPNAFEDGNTQLTLIERSADLNIKSDTMQGVDDDDDENAAFFDLNAFHKRPSTEQPHSPGEKDESVPMKIPKASLDADARSSVQPFSSEQAFDIGSVVSSASNFSFAFGGNKEDNSSEVFTFGSSGNSTSTTTTLPSTSKPTAKTVAMRSTVPTQSVRPTSRKQKEYSLKAYYPGKLDGMELKILEQPESQHRARYQTEGSRGAIKDISQQGFPVIKLFGYNKPTKMQVFIGDECGRVKPHGFYQACRVFGKNSTACQEQDIEGTTVIEIEVLPENDMTVKLDCIGILKLRNADVERRIGPKRARDKKKNNTRARLVARSIVERQDGNQQVLQVVSNPIVCTQPVGQPEISRMSLTECSVEGGESLFIIGKNFKNKGTCVVFQRLDSNDEKVLWQADAEIEQEFFQPTHLICKIPPYKDRLVEKPVQAQIMVSCAGKKSDPQKFTYKPVYPVAPPVKQEVPMETDASTKTLPFVSPEALLLNRMVHQTHAQSSTSNSMFQLPPGTLPTIQSPSAQSPGTPISSQIIKPSKLSALVSSPAVACAPSPVVTAPALNTVPSASTSYSNNATLPTSASGSALPTFLLDEKHDVQMPKSASDSSLSKAIPGSDTVVHSTLETIPMAPTSYTLSGNHPEPSLTPSAGAGQSSHVETSSVTSTSLPVASNPIFFVLDPASLNAGAGGDKIQQLLQQILEAQKK